MFECLNDLNPTAYLVLEALGGEEGLVFGGVDHLVEGSQLAAHEVVHHLRLDTDKHRDSDERLS